MGIENNLNFQTLHTHTNINKCYLILHMSKKITFLICILINKSSLLLKTNLKEKHIRFKVMSRTFLVVHWLGFHDSTAGIPGSISGWGTKIPQV